MDYPVRTGPLGFMEKIVDFREHAEECRSLAKRARSPRERLMLLDMAESWERLAATRERLNRQNAGKQ